MRHPLRAVRCVLALLLAAAGVRSAHSFPPAQPQTPSIATNAPAPLSTRVVDYQIDARIDTDRKQLDASETLTYKNLTPQPLTTFPFHLYLNAFQPDSTFTAETHFGGGVRDSEKADSYPDRKRGSITLAALEADGYGDLLPLLHFTAPDDGNRNDRTVAELTLPRPLAPGDSISFHIRFHDQFPESVARNGYKRDFLMGGQWYPKLGVFWRNAEHPEGRWNCHQYHATTEFFSDFGTFNVSLTLPKRYIVGASGVPTGETANPDGTRTLHFYGEDIHDFAWAASPHFTVTDGTFQSSMGPVKVHVLALAAHPGAGDRYLKILLGSLDQFDRRYGPYPYKILTLIDPEPDSEIGGMEYPTLVTGDTPWLNLTPTNITEITAEHEFGHQYWYGMVATNEFEEAWLDEGINSYTEGVVMDALLGRDKSFFSASWASGSDPGLHYVEYISEPDYDPITRHAWQFRDAGSYGDITYGKSGTMLRTLAGLLGQETMDDAMRTYFLRFRFQHPTGEDFLHTVEEVAARHGHTESLRPFFTQAVYGTAVLDYAVDSIVSSPEKWWLPAAKDGLTRSTVTVRRIGDFRLPIDVEVVFADGARVREHWAPAEGENDRWQSYTYLRKAPVSSAEVDPDHLLQLDVNRFNNSRTVAGNNVAAHKLGNVWLSGLQFVSQLAGWLV